MSERRTDDTTLIAAVRIIARTIQSEEGVIPACLAEAANRLETLVDERRWIPVGERLPESGVEVLCFLGPGAMVVGEQNTDSFGRTVWTDDEGYCYRPTHWQPLPPPPEVE